MTKNQLAILIFVFLIIGLAIYNIHFFTKLKAAKMPLRAEKPMIREDYEIETLKRKAFDKGWGQNPFFRPGEKDTPQPVPTQPPPPMPMAEEKPLPTFRLEMILASDGQRGAILSGQFVKEGDLIGEERVVIIRSDRVVLEREGRQRTIKLAPFSNPFQIEGGR